MLTYTLKNIIDGTPCENFTHLIIDGDEKYLTIEFHCEYSGKYDTPYARYNDPIYRGEVVEFFIGAKDEEIYYEFDLAPNDTLFNAKIFFHKEHGAFTKVIDEQFVLHRVEKKKNEYVAVINIPFEKIGGKERQYIFNAYRIASNGEKKEFQALNPIGKLDFHCRDKFIELRIENKK